PPAANEQGYWRDIPPRRAARLYKLRGCVPASTGIRRCATQAASRRPFAFPALGQIALDSWKEQLLSCPRAAIFPPAENPACERYSRRSAPRARVTGRGSPAWAVARLWLRQPTCRVRWHFFKTRCERAWF